MRDAAAAKVYRIGRFAGPGVQPVLHGQAAQSNDAHRRLHPSLNLAAILNIQSQYKVGNDYTIGFANTVYELFPPPRPGLRSG